MTELTPPAARESVDERRAVASPAPSSPQQSERPSGQNESMQRNRAPLRRVDVYERPIVDGRELSDNLLTRLSSRARLLLMTKLEAEEALLERRLRDQPGVSRTNTVALISPKGGVGKTTSTFIAGNLLATHLKLRCLAVDLNPDFGTLAALAPDAARVESSMAELLRDRAQIGSAAELRRYVSRLPSGLHLLAAPPQAEVIDQMTPSIYDELLTFVGQFYDVILLDLGTGVAGPIAQFAIQRADQAVVVTTPEWITATNVLGALRYLQLGRATLVVNQAVRNSGDSRALEAHFETQRLSKRVAIPYDQQLRTMLDSGTYSLAALRRRTRVPVKQLGLAVADQLA